jgi:RecB family exonuclease
VHECLERVDWHQGIDIPALTEWATDQRSATPGEIDRLTACLERARDHEVATTLAAATEVRTEVPFATLIDGYLITGVMDALATLPDGSTLIVDWKTGEHFAEHRTDYELQIGIYLAAYRALQPMAGDVRAQWISLEGDTELVVTGGATSPGIDTTLTIPAVAAVATRDFRCEGCPATRGLCPATYASAE